MRYLFLLFSLVSFSLLSCDKDRCNPDNNLSDTERIEAYLTENNLTATATASGLYYIITQEGTGGHPNINATVTVKYKGYCLKGRVFDETKGDATATFPLKNLIDGWIEGIPLLKKGGKGTFLIPSYLGYGPYAQGDIPANSVLIFEIELVNFQ
jgi:FKBP-type peptidyl-prolyl cis-trans isomerase FkpA